MAVLADDLARRLRRALADEQNQVLDRLRQDRKRPTRPRRPARPATTPGSCAWPRPSSPACGRPGPQAGAPGPGLAARLAGEVADGVPPDIDRRVERGARTTTTSGSTSSRPVREAFRAWRTDRILPLATERGRGSAGRPSS